MARRSEFSGITFFNAHNQNVLRAEYQGAGRRPGFYIDFDSRVAGKQLSAHLDRGFVAIEESSIESIIETTDDTKQQMRRYLDGHFTGSAMHGNMHRRVSNAAVQSIYFREDLAKGQFGSLIYSKWGHGRGAANFVDFMMLHMRGGTVRAKDGGWMPIRNRNLAGASGRLPQIGEYPLSDSRTFLKKSPGGKTMFLLQAYGRHGTSAKWAGKIRLLVTFVKELKFEPRLAGLEAIMGGHRARFERNFNEVLGRKLDEAA